MTNSPSTPRLLWLWLPNWPWQRLRRDRPEWASRSVVIVDEQSRPAQVRSCSPRAAAAGVVPPLPAREARALASARPPSASRPATRGWVWQAHDAKADRQALVELAHWCQRFSPHVALEEQPEPEGLSLDITGCGRHFGGEAELVSQLVQGLAAASLICRVAVADTLGAAWALAHARAPGESAERSHWRIVPPGESTAALASLPIDTLRLPRELSALLHQLGLDTVGQVTALPRGTLASRLGPALLPRVDQAMGLRAELTLAEQAPEPLRESWTFESPCRDRATIERVVGMLLERLTARLRASDRAARQLLCRLHAEPIVELTVGVSAASASAEHWQGLCRLKLERVRLPSEVCRVELEWTATSPRVERQQWLLDDANETPSDRELAELVDRLASRLGSAAVCQVRTRLSAPPEQAVRTQSLVTAGPAAAKPTRRRRTTVERADASGNDQRPDTEPRLRPLRLAARPRAIQVWSLAPDGPPQRLQRGKHDQPLVRVWGPERIETGWWRGSQVARDYYQVETGGGERLWLFRRLSDGAWFLHGWFD